MSKINIIQSALKELDGAKFQKLADAYLKKRGYDFLNPLGSVIGSDKVRKGTPDTLVTLPNGKFTFVEHTTTSTNLFSKCNSDIDKCLDETKTGIPYTKIEEIVICHTGSLSAEELYSLSEKCQEKGVNLNIFDLGVISYDLLDKYRGIAKDFLSINVDSGQIVSPEDFIRLYGRNKLSTRLDTNFYFRETDLLQLDTSLNRDQLTILSGKAGVGKTRLALEAIRRYQTSHPEFEILCIFNIAGLDLNEDLRIYLGESKQFLILVDDANRISKFEYIAHILKNQRDDQTIKVIATVRDYALENILQSSKEVGISEVVKVEPFTDVQIKELVESECQILNYLYQERIVELADGNPRLAIMMAELSKREEGLEGISNVSALYDEYYATIRQDLEDLNNKKLLKIAAIISFFRVVDRKNEPLMKSIENAFTVQVDEFWAGVKRLHDLEIVDVYEDEVVKVSDQVLSTYLFYLALFKDKVFSFDILLNSFFPKQRKRVIDALNPLFNAFDSNILTQAISPCVDRFWKEKIELNDRETLYQVMEVFWFLEQTNVLLYISEEIDNLSVELVDVSKLNFDVKTSTPDSPIINILKHFKNSNEVNFRMALNLLCNYLEKRPSELSQFLYVLKENFGFTHKSYLNYFLVQKILFEVIIERSQQGGNLLLSRVFLNIAKEYLMTNLDCHENNGNDSINIIKFSLNEGDEIRAVRSQILDALLKLFSKPEYRNVTLDVLDNYCTNILSHSVSSIIEQDSKKIIPFINEQLSPLEFKHCLIANAYFNFLFQLNIKFDVALKVKFESETFKLYSLFITDYSEKKAMKLGYEKYEEFKKKRMIQFAAKFHQGNFKRLIDQSIEVSLSISSSHFEYEFQNNFCALLILIAKSNQDLYIEIFKYYSQLGKALVKQPFGLVLQLIQCLDHDKAYGILVSATFPNKTVWLFCFYQLLPKELVKEKDLAKLLNLYKESELCNIPFNWNYLLNYIEIEPKIIFVVAELIVRKSEAEEKYAGVLGGLFDYSDISLTFINQFENQAPLLIRAYLLFLETTNHPDYNGQAFNQILNLDPSFIVQYIEWMFLKKSYLSEYDDERDYSFLWERDNYKELMQKAVDTVFLIENKIKHFSFIKVFFNLRKRGNQLKITDKQSMFLVEQIASKSGDKDFMQYIFSIITCLPIDDKVMFYSKFVSLNSKYLDFEMLPILTSTHSWSGSRVPVLQDEVDDLEKLLPLFNTVALLKHKQKIESMISSIRNEIVHEKKRDFMDEFRVQ